MTDTPLVSTRNLERVFSFGSEQVRAIHNVDMEVFSGQLFIVTGRSGSGKTTLLNLLAGFDRPTSGTVSIEGQDLSGLSEWELTRLRRQKIGFVFQSFALLPLLSTYENVELPLRIAGWGRRERFLFWGFCLCLNSFFDSRPTGNFGLFFRGTRRCSDSIYSSGLQIGQKKIVQRTSRIY